MLSNTPSYLELAGGYAAVQCSSRVGVFNRKSATEGAWFGVSNVCVSGVPLPKWHTSRIYKGHEDLSSCKAVLETIKFEEKPSCAKMDLKKFEFHFFCRIYI